MNTLDEATQRGEQLSLPALHLLHSQRTTFSKIGGVPSLPSELSWPIWKGEPLAFLAQLDLAEIPQEVAPSWLPKDGLLFFFYDKEQSTWGFDPADRGSWRVLYSSKSASEVEAEPAEEVDLVYGSTPIEFKQILSRPSWERMELDTRELTDREGEALAELHLSVFGDLPKHQMFGFPAPVQGDGMELECQLVSNGMNCGSPVGYESEEALELSHGAKEWRLLLQLDTDDDLGMMWGDVGMLYFWIRESDATNGDFSNVWMVLQCS